MVETDRNLFHFSMLAKKITKLRKTANTFLALHKTFNPPPTLQKQNCVLFLKKVSHAVFNGLVYENVHVQLLPPAIVVLT